MIKYLDLCNFCPCENFRRKVIEILCGNDGLFDLSSFQTILEIYKEMEDNVNSDTVNAPKVKIYQLGQNALNGNISTNKLLRNNTLSCGHDLPVWINDPCEAELRIMVLSQDPRRNKKEMGKMKIGISSPFGLHSIYWRSNKNTGMIHQMAQRIIKDYKYGKDVCFYYTDILKLRGTDSKDMDNNNIDIYKRILRKEIELFKPTIVLLLGKEAKNAYDKVSENMESSFNATEIKLPHPNARIKNGKWGGFKLSKKGTEGKIDVICKEIKFIILIFLISALCASILKKIGL